MRMLIKNGRVIDPASNTDDIRDILVEDGVIAEVAKDIDKAADTVVDAKGMYGYARTCGFTCTFQRTRL